MDRGNVFRMTVFRAIASPLIDVCPSVVLVLIFLRSGRFDRVVGGGSPTGDPPSKGSRAFISSSFLFATFQGDDGQGDVRGIGGIPSRDCLYAWIKY